jgi:hypothetical protein
VEEGVRRVIPEAVPDLTTALVGLLGVLIGLLGNYGLQRFGRVWCEPSSEVKLRELWGNNEYGHLTEQVTDVEKARAFKYSLHLDLFNSKDIPVGLRDISVVFIYEDGTVSTEPNDGATRSYSQGQSHYDELHVINLPPKHWVHKELVGWVERREEQALANWQRVEFVGKRHRRGIFERKTFKVVVDER